MFAALVGGLSSARASASLGPDAATCSNGGSAMLVRVTGLKNRVGKVRVRAFTGNPATYFSRGSEVRWIEVPIPTAGPVEICVATGRPGTFAVDVRHDVNRNGKTDLSDGVGASGNPQLTMLDIILKRRPPANIVQVAVGRGVTVVPVQVRYRG